MTNNGGMASEEAEKTSADQHHDSKVYHTVTACVRCRQRKTRCDPTLPACEPCQRSNSHCEYYDSTKNRPVPRRYIVDLQDNVKRLQAELKALQEKEGEEQPDHESMARTGGLVKFNESNESRFLGPSSGIAITRFVMDNAKRYAGRKTIRDVVTDKTAEEIKQHNNVESSKPTSKVYPLIAAVAAPSLPNRELMEQLLQLYNAKAQYMLPLLHEPTFREHVDAVYDGSCDSTLNFQVRMVIAISMQKLNAQYAGLADSYYLAALPFLTDAIQRRDISTLQCFALIAQYSLLTPTRTAAYWVVGLAAKLCQDLGLCDEKTIDKPPLGFRPNFLEIDMRRRLFWIITSMEYGLSHSLGRPSAFGVSVDNINVGFFQLCDDRFITPQGLLPGHTPIMKKCISIHFLKMRLLQAEIRRTLYLRKREAPLTDQDPWFQTMLNAIDAWMRDTPKNDEGSGVSPAWFEGRKNTMIVFMYRPSPQIPMPSPAAAERCYAAAAFNIALQKAQVANSLIDITWIFTQAIFMALNTVLWSVSYENIRICHPREEVEHHVQEALQAIEMCANRWPGVQSAHHLYKNLVSACLRAYDQPLPGSPVSKGSDYRGTDSSQSPSASHIAHSPMSTTTGSMQNPQSPSSFSSYPLIMPSSQASNQQASYDQMHTPASQAPFDSSSIHSSTMFNQYNSTSPSEMGHSIPYTPPSIDGLASLHIPNSTRQLPSWESMSTTAQPGNVISYTNVPLDRPPWLAPFGEDFNTLGQAAGLLPYQMASLSQQEQLDLLASLESSRLPEISAMGGDSTVFYTATLP